MQLKFLYFFSSLYNKYKSDTSFLIEQTESSAKKIKSSENALLKHRACESLLQDNNYNSDVVKKMSEKYLERYNQLSK